MVKLDINRVFGRNVEPKLQSRVKGELRKRLNFCTSLQLYVFQPQPIDLYSALGLQRCGQELKYQESCQEIRYRSYQLTQSGPPFSARIGAYDRKFDKLVIPVLLRSQRRVNLTPLSMGQ